MSTKDLLVKPHNSKAVPHAWWYEESAGITVIVQPQQGYTHLTIPWRTIEAALKRKRKP